MKHAKIKIFGIVQGVGFRFYTTKQARSLGIKGWVKNMPDGSVLCEAEGTESALNDFIKALKKGPISAKVKNTNIEKSNNIKNYKAAGPKGLAAFFILG